MRRAVILGVPTSFQFTLSLEVVWTLHIRAFRVSPLTIISPVIQQRAFREVPSEVYHGTSTAFFVFATPENKKALEIESLSV